MRSAEQWGRDHGSCSGALVARRAYDEAHPGEGQAGWYREGCERGDWLLWQLARLTPAEYLEAWPAVYRALSAIVERAIRRVLGRSGCPAWEAWAQRWLSREDRSEAAATAAWAEAAAEAAGAGAARAGAEARARAEELLLRAVDIRREIPEWRWEV